MSILSSFIVNVLLLFSLFSKSLEISDKNLIDSSNLKNEPLPIILNDEKDNNIIEKRKVSRKSKKFVSNGGQQINNINSDSKELFALSQQQLLSNNAQLQQQLQSIQSQLQQQLLSITAQLQQQLQSIQAQLSLLIMGFRIPQTTTGPPTLAPTTGPTPAPAPYTTTTTPQPPAPAYTYTPASISTRDIRQPSHSYTTPTYSTTKFTTRSFSQPTTNFYTNTNGYTSKASTPSGK
ncbi:Hypothetical protein SRAE_X000027200 [Strongyloides ratti]|uniref:Uncharacterized protein n=1 Tax=Strongyloides ratti TaxID=34506 RepID=A0A090LRW0_STRRB|nr:Hypothetical protein SRAE_X000027200 [Strongyloides ratti]CEF70942.1 Hypothetical protein SRAE_X000027200 [Strongyloides ratti]